MADRLAEARRAWAAVVGEERVVTDVAARARTTLPSAPAPVVVVRPAERAQVAEVVRVAARCGVPVYPVSRGFNWGWGDACPPGPGQALLDLADLDRIVSVDPEVGVAVVEPGVTQGQLAQHLADHYPGWVMDATTAGPGTSVVGNVVERGIGQTAFADRFSYVAGMEVVLGDGRVLRTGFGHGPGGGGRVARAARWGVGPWLDGLFSQSNLGVVTELGLWLMPRPERVEASFLVAPDAELPRLVDAVRELKLRGALTGAPHMFPIRQPPGEPLRWLVVGSIAGTEGAVADWAARVDGAMEGWARSVRYLPGRVDEAGGHAALLERLGLPDAPVFREFLDAGSSFAVGWPLQLSPGFVLSYVGGAAGQGREDAPPTSIDPLDEGYGFEFSWPVAPAVGGEVRRMVNLVVDTLAAHGRPPSLTLSWATARWVTAVVRVAFDRRDPEGPAAARAAADELLRVCAAAGYPPARASIATMGMLDDGSSFWDVVRTLKATLDPAGILAPGRYAPPPLRSGGGNPPENAGFPPPEREGEA